MKATHKYVRDAKGRFAKVASSAPAPAKFFHEFTPDEQISIKKQEKADRAKARKAKAALAGVQHTNPGGVQEVKIGFISAAQMNAQDSPLVAAAKKPVAPNSMSAEKGQVYAATTHHAVYAGNNKYAAGHTKETLYKIKGDDTYFGSKSKTLAKEKALEKAMAVASTQQNYGDKPGKVNTAGLSVKDAADIQAGNDAKWAKTPTPAAPTAPIVPDSPEAKKLAAAAAKRERAKKRREAKKKAASAATGEKLSAPTHTPPMEELKKDAAKKVEDAHLKAAQEKAAAARKELADTQAEKKKAVFDNEVAQKQMQEVLKKGGYYKAATKQPDGTFTPGGYSEEFKAAQKAVYDTQTQIEQATKKIAEKKKMVAEARLEVNKAKLSTTKDVPEVGGDEVQILDRAYKKASNRAAEIDIKIKEKTAEISVTPKGHWDYDKQKYVDERAPLIAQLSQLRAQHSQALLEKAQAKAELDMAKQKKGGDLSPEQQALAGKKRALGEASLKLTAATARYNKAKAAADAYAQAPAQPTYPAEMFTELSQAKIALDQARVERRKAQLEVDRATGKLDVNDDVTDPSWTSARKMNSSISAMNSTYQKEDPEFRKRLGYNKVYGADNFSYKTVESKGELPPDIAKAHRDYTAATYRHINKYLRGEAGYQDKAHPEIAYWNKKGGMPTLVNAVSSLINDHGYKTEEPVTVMRGVRGNASYNPAEIYKEGSVVTEQAFTSVTVSKKIQQSFAKPRGFKGDNSSWSMYVRLPAGTSYQHGNKVESEMILDKGTQFKVLKVDKEKNQIFLARVGP